MNTENIGRTFIETPIFIKRWKEMGLNDDDLRRLQSELLSNPEVGKIMSGTGGLRKMRFKFEGKGKSGSVRVIYIDLEIYEAIYLISAYQKNEKESLTDKEKNELKEYVKILIDQIAGD